MRQNGKAHEDHEHCQGDQLKQNPYPIHFYLPSVRVSSRQTCIVREVTRLTAPVGRLEPLPVCRVFFPDGQVEDTRQGHLERRD
jgi:hypothetical protein